jgi:hypothetical protein
MLQVLLLSLHASLYPSVASLRSCPGGHTAAMRQENAEYEQRRKAAGDDTGKLWDLYLWCKQKKIDKEGRSTLRQILKLEPDHKEANEALGNVSYDGKWFPSQKKIDEYKKEQEQKQAKEKGLVKYKNDWVPAADLPFLEKGLVKNEKGEWVDAEAEKKIQEGWVKQDMEWIAPTDKSHLEKSEWKCGDDWLTLEKANQYHSDPEHWWRIPGEHFALYTTCDREVAIEKVKKNLELAWVDLARIYGQEPRSPVIVVILRDQDQYGKYAAGDQDASVPPTESHGLSSVHYAFFADVGFDATTSEFLGAGVSYWDASTDVGNIFGVHSVRHALGQSFAEALDPSPKALEKLRKSQRPDMKGFWAEKRIPAWFRWGAATYAERYFIDTLVKTGGNSHWARDWSVTNIVSRGGLRPLKEIFQCDITNEGGDDSQKLINEEGLVMAFVVDGNCAPVKDKYKALQGAMKEGKDAKAIASLASALQAEVEKHEADLRKFAGI